VLDPGKKIAMRLANIPWQALPAWLIGNRLRILMYHSISDNLSDPHATSPHEFERHLCLLQSAQVISLKDGLPRLREKRTLKNTWVITFDDALLDFYTTALPILKQYCYPAFMFVPTGLVGKSATWDGTDTTKPLMTWAQLEESQRSNVTFGSHTVNHPRLTDCSDDELKFELQFSLQILQDRLDRVMPSLSYPGGYQSLRVRQAVCNAGYECAVGTSSHWGNGPESDLFQLRRQYFNS
jgi:peptidoglycan/xylan/chitin deacetylase (PgdA/CDA1 family)